MSNVTCKVYRLLSDAEKENVNAMKDLGEIFCTAIDNLGQSREFSLAKTKIEEAVMWATKGITK